MICRLYPNPHTFAAGILVTASACAVHTLPDPIFVDVGYRVHHVYRRQRLEELRKKKKRKMSACGKPK